MLDLLDASAGQDKTSAAPAWRAAMGEACAALAAGQRLPERLADFGIAAAGLSPDRLSSRRD